MSSGRDEWLSRQTEENKRFWDGVTGKKYEQMEFDFPSEPQPKSRSEFTAKISVASHVDKARAIAEVLENGLGTYNISDLEVVELCIGAINDQLQMALDLLEC